MIQSSKMYDTTLLTFKSKMAAGLTPAWKTIISPVLANTLPGMTGLIYCARPSYTDRHFVSTASCVKMTLALPTKKLGCHEMETNISNAYEN